MERKIAILVVMLLVVIGLGSGCVEEGDKDETDVEDIDDIINNDTQNKTSNITIICDNDSCQTHPGIWGDIVVWEDYRNGSYSFQSEIYIYNIITKTETKIAQKNSRNPFIYKDKIVYQKKRVNNSTSYWDICLYNISTKSNYK